MTTTIPTNESDGDRTDRVAAAIDELLTANDPRQMSAADFLGAQYDAGLAWVHFPVGYGGLGLPPSFQKPVDERVFAAGAPSAFTVNPIGFGMGAPVVVAHGSEAQKQRYLRPLFTCEEVWCQLFSEPGAGSDVASLSTTAVRDGDEWIVNGQKVWTTLAHKSSFAMLAARTDPTQPKHKGLTYFVMDMHAPGVEVRPLRQMTGEAEFNEVYMTDVRIPDAERLGDIGRGWDVVLTTLMNERFNLSDTPRGGGSIGLAVDLWRQRADTTSPYAQTLRDRLVQQWIQAEVLRLTNLRASSARVVGVPGPEGSVGKLAVAESLQQIMNLCLDIIGPQSMLYTSYEMVRPDRAGIPYDDPQKAFLRSRATSIEGGTSEVMRNILGERVLGLPGDVRVDKELPWSEVPRS
jgi:alkylation response protein AidB-like acyl-CoA dehydrogenase